VFYTTLGDDREHRATAAALASARGHLRKVIGSQVRMKVLPELRFEQEDAQGGPDRIERLLRELHEQEGT
jgi:ribosome-binding factor A